MRIDLPQHIQKIRSALSARISNFELDNNPSPSGGSDTIQQIVLAYEFEQAGWVCVVFDTRPDATLDGEWTQVIEETAVNFKHWGEAFWNADSEPFDILFPDGQIKSSDDIECEDFSIALGESLKDMVVDLLNSSAFNTLPLSPNFNVAIEDFNGYFGWLSDEEDSEA